jgi:Tfp pilus assembly protein PilE
MNALLIKLKNNQGSNMVELAVVVLIVALILTIAIPTFFRYASDAKITAVETNSRTVAQVLAADKAINGDYPLSINDLAARLYGQESSMEWKPYQAGVSESENYNQISISSQGADQIIACMRATTTDTLCQIYNFAVELFTEQNMNPENILAPNMLHSGISPYFDQCWANNEADARGCLDSAALGDNEIFDSDFEIAAWNGSSAWMTSTGTSSLLYSEDPTAAADGVQVQRITTNGLTALPQGRSTSVALTANERYRYRIAVRANEMANAYADGAFINGTQVNSFDTVSGASRSFDLETNSQDGSGSAAIVFPTSSAAVRSQWATINVPNQNARERQLNLYVKASDLSSQGKELTATFQARNPDSIVNTADETVTLTSTWQRVTVNMNVDSSVNQARVIIQGVGAGTTQFKLDDVEIINNPETYPQPLKIGLQRDSGGALIVDHAPSLSYGSSKMALIQGVFTAPVSGDYNFGVSSVQAGLGIEYEIDSASIRELP